MGLYANVDAEADCMRCGRSQADRPAIYRGENWCSGNCRSALGHEA